MMQINKIPLQMSELNGERIVIIKSSIIYKFIFSYYNRKKNRWLYVKDDYKYNDIVNVGNYLFYNSKLTKIVPKKSMSILCVYKNELRTVKFGRHIHDIIKSNLQHDNIIIIKINSEIIGNYFDFSKSSIEKFNQGFLTDMGMSNLYTGFNTTSEEFHKIAYPMMKYHEDNDFLNVLKNECDLDISDIIIDKRNKIIDGILIEK